MYRDNTLIPSEAVRLLALGILAGTPTSYAELAREVRHFTGRIVGPSLDLVGAPQVSDLNQLVSALKMRFLHLMAPAAQRVQAELLHDICERELARLTDLREHHGQEDGHLNGWLDLEIAQTQARLDWAVRLRDSLG